MFGNRNGLMVRERDFSWRTRNHRLRCHRLRRQHNAILSHPDGEDRLHEGRRSGLRQRR